MESTASASSFLLFLLLCFVYHSSATTPTLPTSNSSFPNEALPTKSGYLPVNPKTNSAIFYTFYEAQNPTLPLSQTPLLIWLQGGPGCSSMVGNFLELGPYRVVSDSEEQNITLQPNLGSWNRIFGLIFLDNPIGTGFSIASKHEEIPRDQNTVAKHLFYAITKFLESDPVFKTRSIYITGESYAGKYVPAIGHYILKKNMKLPVSKQVNLKGVAIGNGLTDPVTQVRTHAVNAYFAGFINDRQKKGTGGRSKRRQLRLATLYDFTRRVPYETSLVTEFLQSVEVKKALGCK
ncbi:hypothetical protein OIU78_021055 [Salix suchowensis]|nr:hypothetical protein OIU78_021055 [Salix suchowensis]